MKFISYCSKTFSPAVSKFLIVAGLSVSFASCQWGDEVDAIVQPNPDDLSVVFSDSNSVLLSTLATDSMMTGSARRHLIGRFVDPYFGKMHATSFIQLGTNGNGGFNTGLSLPETAVYDSLVLNLRYDGYFYGDTTKVMNVNVHTLQQDMMDKSVYYNNDGTPYDSTPVGKASFYPTPRPGASAANQLDLKLRLSDVLGKKIFDMVKSNQITNSAQWIDLLKGLAIIPAASDNNAVIGFVPSATAIRLYHHTPAEVEGVERDSISVPLVGVYNQTGGDRKGTVLANLPTTYRSSLPSSKTDHMAFVQAGTGIMTRLDFPGIRQYKNLNYTFANSAQLIIEPLRNSFSKSFYLPTELHAYITDKNNDYVYSGSEPISAATGRLVNDLVNDRQYYVMDVTQFIRDIMQSETEQTYGLLLRTSSFSIVGGLIDVDTEFSKSFNRLVLGDQMNANGRVKLEIKYTNIKTQ